MILGDSVTIGGGGASASIFAQGALTSADSCYAVKDGVTYNGVWTTIGTTSGFLISNLKEYGTYTVMGVQAISGKTNSIDVLIDSAERYDLDFSFGRLPSSFTEVEWLQSSGSQWIILYPWTNSENTIFKGEVAFTRNTDWDWLFGNWSDFAFGNGRGSNVIVATGANYSTSFTVSKAPLNTKFELEVGGGQMRYNGILYTVGTGTQPTGHQIFLFGADESTQTSTTTPYWKGTCRVYSAIFYNGTFGDISHSVKQLELVPCYCNETVTAYKGNTTITVQSGTLGMYDLVNSKFHINGGTGTFTAGSPI